MHPRQPEQRGRRRVGVLDPAALALDGDRLRQRAEDAVQPPLRGGQPADELRVREREPGASDQQLRERQIGGAVAPSRAADRRRRERPAARRSARAAAPSSSAAARAPSAGGRRRRRARSRRRSRSSSSASWLPSPRSTRVVGERSTRSAAPRASSQASSSSRSGPSARAASRRGPPAGLQQVDPGGVGEVGDEQADQPPQRLVDVRRAVRDPRRVAEQAQLAPLGLGGGARGDRGLALARDPGRRSPSRRRP